MVKARSIAVAGTILIWGACTPEGRQDVMAGTGISDVLSLEEVIASLIATRNAEYQAFVEDRKRWCSELFGFLAPTVVALS
jgi:hypothetical protein